MIIDTLAHARTWLTQSPRIALALQALAETDLASRPDGRYELDGDRVYAMVQRYKTRTWEGALQEAHRRHLDVQFVASGTERIGYAPLADVEAGCEVVTPYDPARDVALWKGYGDLVALHAGMIAVLWPVDVHAPTLGYTAQGGDPITKVVVKVRLDD